MSTANPSHHIPAAGRATAAGDVPTSGGARSRPGGAGRLGDRTVSRVGYGAMQLSRLRDDRDAAVALLHRAAELGVDHIDTADFYGDGFVNEVIRDAFGPRAGRRTGPADAITVVSKVGAEPNPGGDIPLRLAQQPQQLRASVEVNLQSLGTDHIPVVNLRRTDAGPGLRATGDQVVDLDDQLAVLTTLRDEGTIGAIGLSSVSLDVLRRALPAGIVCVQNAYSLASRDAADEDMINLCAHHGIAWVPYFPLGSAFGTQPKVTDQPAVRAAAAGLGASPSQVGLAWLLHRAPNVLLIPGTADLAHLEANVAAGSLALDEHTLEELTAAEIRCPR